ncbi:MAG TPA: TonB-dependent receptor [Woeseiaceae bacterium]|nr:TonB-dependent receptor [Woeseiaceae bacterium]
MITLSELGRRVAPVAAALLFASSWASLAHAQEDSQDDDAQGYDEDLEVIIATGTRRAERTVAESAVPIDVIAGEELVQMGTTDFNDMLRKTVPSYNVERFPISDAASVVRPATMRGLPPDMVLVLVNGKRRHRSGVIAELGGSLAAGSQGADISSIPALAVKQVEILRDGAAAQYGSDAIAGVINFILKDANDGFAVQARTGEYLEGDGALVQFAANAGLPLGDDGFANVTFQWVESDATSRSQQRTDAATLIEAGNTAIPQPYAQVWGAPKYEDDYNLFINAGIQLTEDQELYGFGNVAHRKSTGGFFYRNPNSRSGVFTNGDLRAIVDTNIEPADSGLVSNCPVLVSPGSGASGVPLDPAAVAADAAALANLPANCFVANQFFPGGYTPKFGGEVDDASLVMGLRGELENGLGYDFSGSYGRNAVAFFIGNTWNPSLGPDGVVNGELQTEFDLGSYIQTETNFNADFVYPIEIDAFASPLNVAFGAEYRDEVFQIVIGEENSWQAGDFAFQSDNFYADGVTPLPNLSIGAHGFAGFSPNQAGSFGRSNVAVYTELEADVVEDVTVAAALRYEDFEDFGNTTNGKLAARWALTDAFALRGSISTGFRAPTPGQSNVTKVSTIVLDGQLQQTGQIPPTNPIARFLGAEPLGPAEAENFSAGLVWDATDSLNLTLDFFQIEVTDRIAATGQIEIAGEPVPPGIDCPLAQADPQGNLATCLQELGIPGAADLNSVAFYTNDFNTTTRGVDLVATWAADFGDAGNGNLTAAWNWTETGVDDAGSEVSRNRVVELEHFNPRNRGIFTYNHFLGDWRFMARASYYGDWIVGGFSGDPTPRGPDGTGYTLDCDPSHFNDECYGSQWLFDLEGAYTFNDTWTAVAGVQNVFDEFGPIDQSNLDGTIGSGTVYASGNPFGYDGGFWYLRLSAYFD